MTQFNIPKIHLAALPNVAFIVFCFMCTRTAESIHETACEHDVIGVFGYMADVWRSRVEGVRVPSNNDTQLCPLTIKSFMAPEDMLPAIQKQEIDYVIADPGLIVCLMRQFKLAPLAGYIDVIDSMSLKYSAGDIIVSSNSSIDHLSDLRKKKIISYPLYDLFGFQAQFAKLADANFDLFVDVELIAFEANMDVLIAEFIQGNFDAAFIPATLRSAFDAETLNILETQIDPRFPFATTSDSFPLTNIASLPTVPDNVLRNVTWGLFNVVVKNDNRYSNVWTASHDLSGIENMQRSVGIMNASGICPSLIRGQLVDSVRCPPNTIKLSQRDVIRNCARFKDQCANRDCICDPCYAANKAPISDPKIFWPVLLGCCAAIVILSWWIQATCLRGYFIAEVPIEHIVFPVHAEILGESRYGKIIKAELRTPEHTQSRIIAMHRLEPSKTGDFNRYFGKEMFNAQNMSQRDIWKRTWRIHQISHPHLLQNYGVVRSQSELLLVQEYAQVGTLQDYLSNQTIILDMATALRIFKEIAMGLQCIHSKSPPLTHHVTTHNVLLDVNYSVLIMLSDNFKLPPFTSAVDVFHFGTLMSYVKKSISSSTAVEHHMIKKHLSELDELVDLCRCSDLIQRPSISLVIKRLTERQYRWGQEYDAHINQKVLTAQQNTEVLHRIFPPHIAEALTIGKTIQPEYHDVVSILFTDIVGYTSIASTLSPLKVSDMLNRLYIAFDELAEVFGVFKVETTGDCWLGTTNLIHKRPDHTTRLASFAEQILNIAQATAVDVDRPEQTLQIRTGIHVGPIVTNVVGSLQTNPRFCLFGDAVNIASRMESTSSPGKIQLSEAAAAVIMKQDQNMAHRLQERLDKPNIKGKGPMQTYWLST